MNKINYRWSDAWILLSIISANYRKQYSMTEIIACADYMQRAIPNYEEMQSGIFRLIKGEYITEKNDKYKITKKTKQIYKPLENYKHSTDQLKEIEKAIGALPWDKSEKLPHPDNIFIYDNLDNEKYKKSVEDYKMRFRILRKPVQQAGGAEK